MRRLILHVGPHKTGSTSIQTALAYASEALLKLGICYPSEWRPPGQASHFALYEQLRDKRSDLVKSAATQALGSKANTIVLSAEDLCRLGVDELSALSRAFRDIEPDLTISVVFYVRRWSGLIPSVVQELIKHAVVSTLSDVIAAELLSPERSDLINYMNRLDRLCAVFGVESLNIISFDNLAESKENLVDHFFKSLLYCAWNRSNAFDIDVHRNVSLSPFEVEFLRVHHCLANTGSIGRLTGDVDEYLRRLRASNPHELVDAMKGSVRGLVIDETAWPFTAVYDRLHAKYYNRFLNPGDAGGKDPLFRRIQRNVEYIQPNYLCDPNVLKAMINLNQSLINQTT